MACWTTENKRSVVWYNVEISNVPEHENENLMNIVTNMGKSVKVDIRKDDICFVHRVQKINKNTDRSKSYC